MVPVTATEIRFPEQAFQFGAKCYGAPPVSVPPILPTARS